MTSIPMRLVRLLSHGQPDEIRYGSDSPSISGIRFQRRRNHFFLACFGLVTNSLEVVVLDRSIREDRGSELGDAARVV